MGPPNFYANLINTLSTSTPAPSPPASPHISTPARQPVRCLCFSGSRTPPRAAMQLARSSTAGCTALPQRRSCVAAVSRPRSTHRRAAVAVSATQSGGDKKSLKREEEPEEYWVSKGERKGANPLSDPLAIIGIAAIFLPFVLLGIAIATGLVDLSVYR